MESAEAMARELFHQIMQARHSLFTGAAAILAEKPRCHFDMLHRLYIAIQHNGQDGVVAVSDLTCRMYDSPQAVSRALRVLEKDGLIRREADPRDRRKTTVRLTEEGLHAHEECERAVSEYAFGIMRRMGPENLNSFLQDWARFQQAVEEENAARRIARNEGKE